MFWIIMALAAAGDQFTKYLVSHGLAPGESISVIDGFLDFTYVVNKGASFSILQGQRVPFLILSTVVLALVIWLVVKKIPKEHRLFRAMLGLFCGGVAGNMIDRALLGGVTDFIDLGWFPVFNVADCCICVSAVFICAMLIFGKAGRIFTSGKKKEQA
ncbi:MAG: signal peptidase II [Firmicutes bacterium]|nr:signal peptidase II [Bacillota bacterium]